VGIAPPPLRDEAGKRIALERAKGAATGLLVLALAVFIVARLLEPGHPWLGFVRAAAEASLVGGLADWFAVTALFRRPLGLPIPHTAIVPTQKDRIGRILGTFVQNHFLARDVLAARLRAMRLSERAARWMSDPANAPRLARQVAVGLARTVEALPETEVKELIHRNAVARLESTRIAPIIGSVLSLVVTDDRHQELLDEALRLVLQAVDANREIIRSTIRAESPWWVPGVVDEVMYQRMLAAIESLLDDVRRDPGHPLRRQFDTALRDFIARLEHSPEVIARAESLKRDLLDHPAVEEFAASLWERARRAAARYGAEPDVAQLEPLARGITTLGTSLLANEALLDDLDGFAAGVIASALEQQRHEVAELIAGTVRTWDPELAAERIELAVGRDLQFIRLNGTLVGGLAGLVIYTVALLLG
jgi:uncharacterized membrane-anchored protein YjiN (DUF445 family)